MSETVQQALRRGTETLRAAGISTPDTDARWLLAAALGTEPGRLILMLPDEVSVDAKASYADLLALRGSHKPVSQILGGRLFFGRWFNIDDYVLDPRPETESLIELALIQPFGRVLDLGTGSGAIAISLLAERPVAEGVATDISPRALEVAERNASSLGVADRLDLRCCDWFDGVEGRFDLIVSNPPYITAAAYDALAPDVRQWEPKIALTPGGDGLDPYRIIARDAPAYLQGEGRLLVEIGFDQGKAVSALFKTAGLGDVSVHRDLNGKDRVVSGRKRAETE